MIAKLSGLVDQTGDDWAIIDVGGVGYLVSCSSRTLGRLVTGERVSLMVETWVREDAISLFGFIDAGEREWFRLLTTVQGVGAKVALALLSVGSPEQLLQAIAAQDKTVLTRASGVGPKLAVRILSELKDKAGKIALAAPGAFAPASGIASASIAPVAGGAMEDAISALVNLGYRRIEAFEAVGQVSRELGEGTPAAQLIRAALARFGKDLVR